MPEELKRCYRCNCSLPAPAAEETAPAGFSDWFGICPSCEQQLNLEAAAGLFRAESSQPPTPKSEHAANP